MIGAEPPQLQHRAAPAPARWCWRCSGLSPAASRTRSASTLHDIGFEVRAGEIVGIAGVSGNGQQELMAALSGEDTRAPRRLDHAVRPATSRAHSPRRRRQRRACTSCPRSAWAAARCRRCRWRRTRCSRAPRRCRAAGWIAHRRACARWPQRPDRALQRQGRRPGRGGQEPVGRQPAEVHRRPRDRRRPEAADRLAADLGRRRRRGGADPRRAARAARRRLRAAGGQRGAGRAVRDQRPAGRHRAGAACRPSVPTARGHDRADRRVDVRACGTSRQRTATGGAMLKLEARPAAVAARCRCRRRCWRWRSRCVIGVVLFVAARQGPAARPADVLRRAGEEPVRAVASWRSRPRR